MGRFKKLTGGIPARHVLCVLLFFGFALAFMMRINLSIAIVAMVKEQPTENLFNTTSNKCFRDEEELVNGTAKNVTSDGEFDWNEMQQGIVFGSFFWGYLLSQVPGGRLAETMGIKLVFGAAIISNGILCILMPLLANLHWYLILIIRAIQGVGQGVLFPALNAAVGQWVPLEERDRFISFAVQGATLGTVASLPLCGIILTSLGWRSVFYISGLLALCWGIPWFFLVYDSPSVHPRMSMSEKEYLKSKMAPASTETTPMPWRAALTSMQFWLGCIPALGNDWGFHTLLTLAPKFMQAALGFDITQSSFLSSLPFLCQYGFALIYGSVMDALLERRFPVIWVRRVSIIFSHILPALGLIAITTVGCNVSLSVAILTFSVSMIGAFSCGYFQNPLDVAPNFAGSLTGIMNGVGASTGLFSTPVAGALLYTQGSPDGWHSIFWIAAAIYIITSLPYLLFATAKVQPWNGRKDENEMHPMHCDGDKKSRTFTED
ncbi:sialin-like [Ischnura elegans]|uniref:sialin-like n=1 Tax=Ischnura elegans TaxID=197161 RepID=UPI001ED8A1DB|nr:sialin-like [Ischnura elegans]